MFNFFKPKTKLTWGELLQIQDFLAELEYEYAKRANDIDIIWSKEHNQKMADECSRLWDKLDVMVEEV